MTRRRDKRDIEFCGTPGGMLERIVRLPDGRQYAHHCSKQVFEAVAGYLDEHQRQGVKIQSLADAIDAPMTQVHVAAPTAHRTRPAGDPWALGLSMPTRSRAIGAFRARI